MADNHDDQYEEYNYDDKFYAESASRKGKSKKAHLAAKSHSGSGSKAGQERKIVDTIANAEQKRKEGQKEK